MNRWITIAGAWCLAWMGLGCGPQAVNPDAPTNDWRKHWVDTTPERPVALNRDSQGRFDLRFHGVDRQGGEVRIIAPQNAAVSVSPNAKAAAVIRFDPQTEARWVTFFDERGDVVQHVMLPAMPEASHSLFFHGLSVVLSDFGETVVTLTHEPYVDVIRSPEETPRGVTEMFFVDAAGRVKPVQREPEEGVTVLLPAGEGLALLRQQINYRLSTDERCRWTLERYGPGFVPKWTRTGQAHLVNPMPPRYDVSLCEYRCRPGQASRALFYRHYQANGAVELVSPAPATR